MAGAWATISDRQPGWQVSAGPGPLVGPASAQSAQEKNSAGQVRNLRKSSCLKYIILRRTKPQLPPFICPWQVISGHSRPIMQAPVGYELPIKNPTRKTRAPPRPTCSKAEVKGVSMNLCRIQEMTPNSTQTTAKATAMAV